MHRSRLNQDVDRSVQFLARAEQEIANAGFAKVRFETDTFNQQSQAFYRAMGYVEMGQYPDEEWDSGLMTVLFEKLLAEA